MEATDTNHYLTYQDPHNLSNALEDQHSFYQNQFDRWVQDGAGFDLPELDQLSGSASLDSFQSYSSVATNASSVDYNFYDPLARNAANDNTSDIAWTQQGLQPPSSSSTQPTSASHSQVRGESPPRISEGAFRTQYPAFARLLPGFFALASTLAFFVTPVNIFQDLRDDEDTTEDDFSTENTTLLGVGRLAMQLIVEFATHVSEQEVNIVLGSYLTQILKWFLVDFYKFRQSVRRAARDIICVGYGFSATNSVADNVKLYNDIIESARYAHWFDGPYMIGTVLKSATMAFGSPAIMTTLYHRFYKDKDSLARRMASLLGKCPLLLAACQQRYGFDISWASGSTLNAYLLSLLAVRHDIDEWEEGSCHRTKFNLADAERNPRYKGVIMNNPDLLAKAKCVFVTIASGWYQKTTPFISPPDESDHEPTGRASPQTVVNFGV